VTLVVGLGIDLVEVDRVARLWARHGERAARRLLTVAEWDYCAVRAEPVQHAAVRLAAKEAAFKALAGSAAARQIGWRELEVTPADGGSPEIRFHGRAAARARELGVTRALLTMTHTNSTAGAVVLLLA
jgi:holo-[acyl-carrier protein] synthase